MDSAYPLKMLHFVQFCSQVVSLGWILRWASCKEIRIPKYVKFVLVQCEIQQICTVETEMLGLESGIQLKESGIHCVESESKTVLDSLTRGNPVDLINYWFNCISLRVS